jgi:hypothetical protein
MIETLLGGLMGGAFRLTPEILKWIDRKGERVHELAIREKTLELERIRSAARANDQKIEADASKHASTINTLETAVSTQGRATGVKWADALSSSVRPVITYWFMTLYCAAKAAVFVSVFQNGGEWAVAVKQSWTDADQALWAGVLNFWFLGRVFDKPKH